MTQSLAHRQTLAGPLGSPPVLHGDARLEWTNLNMVAGSDGHDHLYYLTSGGPEGTDATFSLRITNTSAFDFRRTYLKLRLSTQRPNGFYETVPLEGQGQSPFKRIRSERINAGQSRDIQLRVRRETLAAAYDSDTPRVRFEAEFHWKQPGSTDRYNRRSLAFFLFHPIELLFDTTGRFLRKVPMNDPRHMNLWLPIYEKEFSRSDRSPVKITSSITTSLTESQSGTFSISATSTDTRSSETTTGVTASQTSSFGIDDVVKLGVESELTTSSSTTISHSRARQLALGMVRSHTFTDALSRTRSIEATIQPSAPGKRKTLYAYPVFTLYHVKLVEFSGPNRFGQATGRRETPDFPVLVFSHWGEKQVETDASSGGLSIRPNPSGRVLDVSTTAPTQSPSMEADAATNERVIYETVREHFDPPNLLPEPGRSADVHQVSIPAGLKFSRWEIEVLQQSPGADYIVQSAPQRGAEGSQQVAVGWWHLPYGRIDYRLRVYASPDGLSALSDVLFDSPGWQARAKDQIQQGSPLRMVVRGPKAQMLNAALQQRLQQPGAQGLARSQAVITTAVVIAVVVAAVVALGMLVLGFILKTAMENNYNVKDTKYKAAVGEGESKQEHEMMFNLTRPPQKP